MGRYNHSKELMFSTLILENHNALEAEDGVDLQSRKEARTVPLFGDAIITPKENTNFVLQHVAPARVICWIQHCSHSFTISSMLQFLRSARIVLSLKNMASHSVHAMVREPLGIRRR